MQMQGKHCRLHVLWRLQCASLDSCTAGLCSTRQSLLHNSFSSLCQQHAPYASLITRYNSNRTHVLTTTEVLVLLLHRLCPTAAGAAPGLLGALLQQRAPSQAWQQCNSCQQQLAVA
jgi:hypothetical protein